MSQQRAQIFSSDPSLTPYLAHYLQAPSCNILEEEGKFYLCSSYFEKLPLLSTSVKRTKYANGLASVLDLTSPEFDTLSAPLKVEACKRALLFVLNGVLKLKYENCDGLVRSKSISPEVVELGSDYEVNSSGQRVYSASKALAIDYVIDANDRVFRTADRRQPSTKKIWNIARSDSSVARALYHYEKSEDLVELRKVIEEIMADTYIRLGTKTGKVQFDAWNKQKWTEPEVGMNKMEELWRWLHNRHLSNDGSLHSEPFSSVSQANALKALGTTMSLQEAKDIIRILLMKWVTSKP